MSGEGSSEFGSEIEKAEALESCKLYSHLVVKEDSHTLYGFHNKLERQIFRLLISVSGVGASTARVILSSMLPEEIRDAIVSENIALIISVKGRFFPHYQTMEIQKNQAL